MKKQSRVFDFSTSSKVEVIKFAHQATKRFVITLRKTII